MGVCLVCGEVSEPETAVIPLAFVPTSIVGNKSNCATGPSAVKISLMWVSTALREMQGGYCRAALLTETYTFPRNGALPDTDLRLSTSI